MSCEEIKDRLNAEMTDEFYITEAYIPESDFSEIAWASYEITLKTNNANAELAENAKKLLTTSPLILVKKTKSGEKEVDIVPLINSVDATFDESDGLLRVKTTVRASAKEYLNPELIVTAMRDYLDVLSGDPMEEHYSIMRTAIHREDLSEFR
jgi:uncharacterized protein (DUF2344 family)